VLTPLLGRGGDLTSSQVSGVNARRSVSVSRSTQCRAIGRASGIYVSDSGPNGTLGVPALRDTGYLCPNNALTPTGAEAGENSCTPASRASALE
jgi:hypothetical protein